MGCKFSQEEWEWQMQAAELRLIDTIDLPMGAVKRDFITIEMDNRPFKVRTFVVGDVSEGKKTLVMVHGFALGALGHFNVIKQLAVKYRLVLFDNFGWGMNTRLQEGKGMESPESAEMWMIEWILKTFDALNLPEQFLLCGHSIGGWIASIYASYCPEKVESLFLISPAGTMPYDEETYDPYTMRDPDDVSLVTITKKKADQIIERQARNGHPFEEMDKLPACLVKMALKKLGSKKLNKTTPEWINHPEYGQSNLDEEETAAFIQYAQIMHERHSILEKIQTMPFKWTGCSPYHSLIAPDRLGNPNIDFPIGMMFGDMDFFGTEGADEIVRNNKHFESGRSQLFKLKNSTHWCTKDQPQEAISIMIGFFEGTINGRFELKPRYEIASYNPDTNP